MKHLRTYEKHKDNILYKNDEFEIELMGHSLAYRSNFLSSSTAIFIMANLIREHSKYLNDPKLRNISLREVDKEYVLKMVELDPKNLEIIVTYRSGRIANFLGNGLSKSLPDFIYKDLTVEYYPLIKKAIINSEKLGDIIDNFKIIFDKISNEDFELRKNANKYNI